MLFWLIRVSWLLPLHLRKDPPSGSGSGQHRRGNQAVPVFDTLIVNSNSEQGMHPYCPGRMLSETVNTANAASNFDKTRMPKFRCRPKQGGLHQNKLGSQSQQLDRMDDGRVGKRELCFFPESAQLAFTCFADRRLAPSDEKR